MLFLHPQPEGAPCCGDRDPLISSVPKYAIEYKYLSTAWTFMCSVKYLEFNLRNILPNSGTFPLGHFEYNSFHNNMTNLRN